MITNHIIKNVRGHYEIYDDYNKFICSGDSPEEVVDELNLILLEKVRQNKNIKECITA